VTHGIYQSGISYLKTFNEGNRRSMGLKAASIALLIYLVVIALMTYSWS